MISHYTLAQIRSNGGFEHVDSSSPISSCVTPELAYFDQPLALWGRGREIIANLTPYGSFQEANSLGS